MWRSPPSRQLSREKRVEYESDVRERFYDDYIGARTSEAHISSAQQFTCSYTYTPIACFALAFYATPFCCLAGDARNEVLTTSELSKLKYDPAIYRANALQGLVYDPASESESSEIRFHQMYSVAHLAIRFCLNVIDIGCKTNAQCCLLPPVASQCLLVVCDATVSKLLLALHLPSPSPCSGVVPRGVDLGRALREEKVYSRQREIEQHRQRRMSDSSVSIYKPSPITQLLQASHYFYHCPFGMRYRTLLSLFYLSNWVLVAHTE